MKDQLFIGGQEASSVYLKPIVNGDINKPDGGFWTSHLRKNNRSNWLDWSENEMPDRPSSHHTVLTPKRDANLFVVNRDSDIDEALKRYGTKSATGKPIIDFQSLLKDYDGFHVTKAGVKLPRMMGWDVESTVWSKWAFDDQKLVKGTAKPQDAVKQTKVKHAQQEATKVAKVEPTVVNPRPVIPKKKAGGMVPPIDPPDLNKETTVGKMIKDGYSKWQGTPLKGRMKAGAIIGGIIGGVSSDDWGNNLTGTAIDAGIGAGVGTGTVYAADYITKHHGQAIKDVLTKDITVGEMEKINLLSDVEQKVAKEKLAVRAEKAFKMQNRLGIGIAALIGVGAIASVRNHLDHEVRVDQQKADAEKQKTRRENKDAQAMSQYFGYNQHTNMGQLAIDMFNDRIGHHLMGNAKFQ